MVTGDAHRNSIHMNNPLDDDDEISLGSAPQRTLGEHTKLQGTGDVYRYVSNVIAAQIRHAIATNVKPNVLCGGDERARSMFYTLLPDLHQSRLFCLIAVQPEAWPRLKPLFGAPPYGFLGKADNSMLRATGISAGRVNIGYDSVPVACSYTQFGHGQLCDEHGRKYRIVSQSSHINNDPFVWAFATSQTTQVTMHVRISRTQRRDLPSDASTKNRFPMVREQLALRPTKSLVRLLKAAKSEEASANSTVSLTVMSVMPRSPTAVTAAIVARIDGTSERV